MNGADVDDSRYVGIIADGGTDRPIILQLVKSLFGGSSYWQEVFLDQSVVDYMDSFRRAASKLGTYALCDAASRELRRGIIAVLYAAFGDMQRAAARPLCDRDLIVINTDAEWVLNSQDHYYEQDWAVLVTKVFHSAIEEFYHKMRHGHQWEYLPFVCPLVLFPSTDILVAAARTQEGEPFQYHGVKAPEIKRRLYGVGNLYYLGEEGLKEMALDFITPAACGAIYKHVPESRMFLRSLSWNRIEQPNV